MWVCMCGYADGGMQVHWEHIHACASVGVHAHECRHVGAGVCTREQVRARARMSAGMVFDLVLSGPLLA